jgi:leucyl/phenylalanyl-tRNA---protein transferase
MKRYFLLSKNDLFFPSVEEADEFGIVALGGDLSAKRLLLAYRSGIFPWYSEDEPITWWSPDPRFVLYPSHLKVSKSTKQILKKNMFTVTFDNSFLEVIQNCRDIRLQNQEGTWITDEMLEAYYELHQMGYAHSVEVLENGILVGGLYGVAIGCCFFGESMFSAVSNASKIGFTTLANVLLEKGYQMIDCQVHTNYLESLGASFIPRAEYLKELKKSIEMDAPLEKWTEWL